MCERGGGEDVSCRKRVSVYVCVYGRVGHVWSLGCTEVRNLLYEISVSQFRNVPGDCVTTATRPAA